MKTTLVLAASAAAILCLSTFVDVASAAPRNAASKMAGRDFSFDQRAPRRSYRVYRAPVNVVESAPMVAQTPAPAATDNNAAPQATEQAPETTRRFSAEPSQEAATPTYNYYQPRRYSRGFRPDFSAGRKFKGDYLP